jgi:hypothetical protein
LSSLRLALSRMVRGRERGSEVDTERGPSQAGAKDGEYEHVPRVSRVVCGFLGAGLRVLLQPTHFMYRAVNEVFMKRAEVNLHDVPLVEECLFCTDSGEHVRQRAWFANVVAESARDEADFAILRKYV